MKKAILMSKTAAWHDSIVDCSGNFKTPEDALADLAKKGVDAQASELLMGQFEQQDPRRIAFYYYSHGLDQLDIASQQVNTNDDPSTSAVKAIFQCAELCLYGIEDLCRRMEADVKEGRLDSAREKLPWMTSMNETLMRYSRLLGEINRDVPEDSCVELSLEQSPYLEAARNSITSFQQSLVAAGLADCSLIGEKGLADHGRNLTFNALLDQHYQLLWQHYLKGVKIPKTPELEGMDANTAYYNFVAPTKVRQSMLNLKTKSDTVICEFHIFHVLSELPGKAACLFAEKAITGMMADEPNMAEILDNVSNIAALSSVLPTNASPLFRNLSQSEYTRFRALLGTTSGAHSTYVAHGITGPAYVYLMEATRNFLMGKDEFTNDELCDKLKVVSKERNGSMEGRVRYEIAQRVLAYANNVRHWRELHTQFPVVQFGLSRDDAGIPSLSGAKYGLRTAYTMSSRAHSPDDLAAPFYRQFVNSEFPAAISFDDRFSERALGPLSELLHQGAVMANIAAMSGANGRFIAAASPHHAHGQGHGHGQPGVHPAVAGGHHGHGAMRGGHAAAEHDAHA